MLTAIYFNSEPLLNREEIKNERPKLMLAAKLDTRHLTVAK
jgi:hypothetical protein